MRRLLALLTLLVLAASPAIAADPESGKVSRATPTVTWNGAVTSFQSWQTYNQGNGQCIKPSCDTFTLEVADGPAPLKITVESGDSTMFVEVVKPDGSKETFGGEAKATGTVKNAANGTYTINVAQNEQTQATHKGTAQLVFPATSPPAPAPAPGAPAPAPSPGAAPAPAPAATTLSLKAAKPKKGRLPVTIGASAPVTKVAATLKRGKKVVAKGSLARVEGSAAMKLKIKGKPKRGKHTLTVTALDGSGKPVSKTISVKI
jgi:opacity protein-like surface antigen